METERDRVFCVCLFDCLPICFLKIKKRCRVGKVGRIHEKLGEG